MKENKRYIATPITEELLKTLEKEGLYTFFFDDGVSSYLKLSTAIRLDKDNDNKLFTHILIEQPLPSSENKNSMRNFIHDTNSALGRIQRSCDFIAQWLKDNAITITNAGVNSSKAYVSLEYIKTAKNDMQNSIDLLYSQLQTTAPSFPSDEEKLTDSDKWFSANLICLLDLEKQLVKEGKQEVIDREMIFEWVSAFKEQTKNKGGKE